MVQSTIAETERFQPAEGFGFAPFVNSFPTAATVRSVERWFKMVPFTGLTRSRFNIPGVICSERNPS
jgi:hypothetical protein